MKQKFTFSELNTVMGIQERTRAKEREKIFVFSLTVGKLVKIKLCKYCVLKKELGAPSVVLKKRTL